MKKGGNLISDKLLESKSTTKPVPGIKFNLSAHNLACFVGKDKAQGGKNKVEAMNEIKFLSQLKTISSIRNINTSTSINRPKAIAGIGNFN